MTQLLRVCTLAVLAIVFGIGLVGCSSAVTRENYAKIQNGDKLEDVEKLMGGKGTEMTETQQKKELGKVQSWGEKVYRWGNENTNIVVVIVGGRVAAKTCTGLYKQGEDPG